MTLVARPRTLTLAAAVAAMAIVCPARAEREIGHGPALPADQVPAELMQIGIDEHLGETVPSDVSLVDEAGRAVVLGDFIKTGRPVVVNFVYHTCPTLCSFVQNGFAASLREVPWSIGDKFDVLTISIDPRDTPQIAAEKKAKWVGGYGRDAAQTGKGWHFLTGQEAELKRLTQAFGFRYAFDAKQGQYAHSAALFVLTPNGKISRYLYGIEFPKNDVRLALAEAAEGKTISTVDHLLLYCYQYDPNARSYVLVAMRVMRLGALATMLGLAAFLGVFWARERKKAKLQPPTPPATKLSDPESPTPALGPHDARNLLAPRSEVDRRPRGRRALHVHGVGLARPLRAHHGRGGVLAAQAPPAPRRRREAVEADDPLDRPRGVLVGRSAAGLHRSLPLGRRELHEHARRAG